jgi:hypothetical protein
LLLLLNLSSILTTLVVLRSFSANIQTLVVLAHGKVSLSLSQICTDELGVALDRSITILHGGGEAKKLDEACSAIGVAARVFRGALDHLAVGFNCGRPVCFLELLIAEFTSFFGFGWVDVRIAFLDDLCFFSSTEFGKNIWSTMFGERALIVVDGTRKVSQLLIRCTDATECPAVMLERTMM